MKSRRTLMVAVAVVLAVAAFVGVVLYANNVRQSAYGDAKLVKVFVVKQAIPKGLAGEQAISQGFVRESQIPQEFKPGSAIARLDDVRNKVALTDLSIGQVVVTGQFVDPNVAQVTFAQRIDPGKVAVTVSVDQIHGVAGLLLPGDKVNMMAIYAEAPGSEQKQISTMYQNVDILAIGTKAAPQAGDTATEDAATATGDSGLITFEVPLEAAERIALAASGGPDGTYVLYLALVPPDNTPVEAPVTINAGNILSINGATPYTNEAQ